MRLNTNSSYHWVWLMLPAIGAFFLGAGLLLAQGTDLDEALTCDPDDLLFEQLATQSDLNDFGPELAEDPEAALGKLYEAGQLYQQLALDCGYLPDDLGDLFVGNDLDQIMRGLENVNGDPINGQLLFNGLEFAADNTEIGCLSCHMDENSTGPVVEGTWTRWDEITSEEPQFADYTFERYIVESIVLPWDYTLPDYAENLMPNNFGNRLSYQDLADLVAYLYGQDQLLPED